MVGNSTEHGGDFCL
ncbi:hypothetical protein CP10743SC13_1603, partial [Chlamydia psittaci 10_743_SC13]